MKHLLYVGMTGLFLVGCVALDEVMDGSGSRQYTTKSFSVPPGGTDSISFNVNAQGSVTASLTTRGLASSAEGGADSMVMALQSPSGANMVQNEGDPHEKLRINYRVPRSAQEGMWKVTLTNNSQRAISGTLKVYYPYEDSTGSTASTGGSSNQDAGAETSGETTAQNEPQQEEGGVAQNQGTQNDDQGSQQTTSQNSGSDTGSGSGQTTAQTPSQPQQGDNSGKIIVYKQPTLIYKFKPVQYGTVRNTFKITKSDSREKFSFHVQRPGKIDVVARWQGTEKLAIILNGPQQNAALKRKDGKGYVHLVYDVKQQDIIDGFMWTATVVRFDQGQGFNRAISSAIPVNGTIEVKYPKN